MVRSRRHQREQLDDVIEAGARRICVERAITQASDPQQAARELRNKLQAEVAR